MEVVVTAAAAEVGGLRAEEEIHDKVLVGFFFSLHVFGVYL